MAEAGYVKMSRRAWKVDVLTRLCQVREDVTQAVGAAGWALDEDAVARTVSLRPQDGTVHDGASVVLMSQAQAVVETTYQHIWKAEETLTPLPKLRQRMWDLLTGELLMSAYIRLHAAESSRVRLLGPDQLAAILPSIRQRVFAYLPADDPNADALKTLPDPTQPAHQTAMARFRAQPAPVTAVGGDAGAAAADGGAGAQDQQPPPEDGAGQAGQAVPAPTAVPAGVITLTGMLGADQQVAAQVMSAACQAEDSQQLEVRHFRGVLYGAAVALAAATAVLWIVGAVHPAYFPLCWPVSGQHPPMICPAGGSGPGAGDVPLVLGLGALGAFLSVALSLASMQPVGARFSLTVAQGLNKIFLGAITAMLGIIVLRTVTSAPGFLASQPGLLATAVVFGYSQQLFTRLIDQQASKLMSAASPTTPAPQHR